MGATTGVDPQHFVFHGGLEINLILGNTNAAGVIEIIPFEPARCRFMEVISLPLDRITGFVAYDSDWDSNFSTKTEEANDA